MGDQSAVQRHGGYVVRNHHCEPSRTGTSGEESRVEPVQCCTWGGLPPDNFHLIGVEVRPDAALRGQTAANVRNLTSI